MATSTNIQYLSASGISELGATVAVGAGTSNRSQIETFVSSGTFAVGDLVSFDASASAATKVLTVLKTTASAGQGNVVGVALEASTATGQIVNVCVAGYCATVNVNALVASGESLTSSATAGRAITYVTGTHTGCAPFAVALSAAVANVCDAWVYKRF
jgi:hypothetical protein